MKGFPLNLKRIPSFLVFSAILEEKLEGQLEMNFIGDSSAYISSKFFLFTSFESAMRASQKSKRFYNWIIGTLILYMIVNFLHEIWLNIYLIGINFPHLKNPMDFYDALN